MKLRSLAITSIIFFSGCLGPVKAPQTTNYVLNTLPAHIPSKPSSNKTLLVLQPETRPAYNTTQMAYTVKPYQVAYFGQNQWAETPSQMLSPLLLQTLQSTRHYRAVVAPPYIGKYDYLLSTQVLQLQQNFTYQPNQIELTISAVLTKVTTNNVVATKQFTVRVPIKQHTPYGGVIAANQALALVLEKLAYFCLKNA